MRPKRLKLENGIYHCMSRTVNGEALFERREKEMLRKMLHQIADFSGVRILTFCLMDNHFHVLVEVNAETFVSDQELMRRYRVLYPKPTEYEPASADILEKKLMQGGKEAEAIRARLLARMGDVSAFMKTLKQRFSTWFNQTYDRFGPLWSDRFKSVLVEGKGNVLQTMAAYIDLNPVRAGIVQDPKDYRFCGYAEAVAGQKNAIAAVKLITGGLNSIASKEAMALYRCALFGKGGSAVATGAHISREEALRVLEEERGALPWHVLLRCRMRYLTEGIALGSQAFMAAQAQRWQRANQRKHPPKPKTIDADEGPEIKVLKGSRGRVYG
ncbi:MAG: transposase [Verrucomicrobia bacterium]|jgi:REP element-mobilizing transposase RayT|nr:transposase [Verrucomicrobiota bacterium]